jgi:hypothetical protein
MAGSKRERAFEQPAVRTTIVGGRPPGAGQGVGEIPRGIEVLVKKASVDPEFKAALLAKRAEAAKDIGLRLDPAEVMMLDAVPAAQLEGIIARTTVSPGKKRAFLGRAAAVMLAALGTSIGCDQQPAPTGERPDRPKAEKSVATKSASQKATTQIPGAPKASTQTSGEPPGADVVVFGFVVRPEKSPKLSTQTPSSSKPSTQASAQKSPIPVPVAGAMERSIDYPRQPGAKASSRTPALPVVGVREDRPGDGPAPKGDVKPTTNAPAAKETPPEILRAVRGSRPLRDDNVNK